MDIRLAQRAERVLGSIEWTLEETLILFLYWCVNCQDQLTAWEQKHGLSDDVSVTDSGEMALRQPVLDEYTETCAGADAETNEGDTQCTI